MKYENILEAALEAGLAILEIYNQKDFRVGFKEDESPLTSADLTSNSVINRHLKDLGLAVLSEENKSIAYPGRKDWKEFFLVDPLDGTKEFIKGNGEFTVNIAIIRESLPVFGVIYAPVPDLLYWGSAERGSWKLEQASVAWRTGLISSGISQKLRGPLSKSHDRKLRVVASKSHFSSDTEKYISKLEKEGFETEIVSRGSSLKFCMIAEGAADLYPRMGPTMEWDTGAGHAIAKFAGCKITDYKSGQELRYNKENLLNPWFVVSAG